MLEVLLAKDGDVGLGLDQKLGDDSGDSSEMGGPYRPFELGRDARNGHGGAEALGIHDIDGRGVEQVASN